VPARGGEQQARGQRHRQRGDGVLGLQPDPEHEAGEEPEPPVSAGQDPGHEPQEQRPHELVEGDRLEVEVAGDEERRDHDHQRGQHLRAPAAAQLAGDQRGEQDDQRPGQDAGEPEGDQRLGSEHLGQPGDQGGDGREVDVPQRQVARAGQVVELVSVPPVPAGDDHGHGHLDRRERDDRRPWHPGVPGTVPGRYGRGRGGGGHR